MVPPIGPLVASKTVKSQRNHVDIAVLGGVHKGRCGEALYFVNALADLSPDLRMVHAGRPTTRGEKWIVSQFIRSRPTR